MGFVLRNTIDFKNVKTYLLLYNSLVRSHFEYATQVWSPFTKDKIDSIEKIQKKIFRTLFFRKLILINFVEFSYTDSLNSVRYKTLECRRKFFDITFLIKILRNLVQSEYLLSKINFYIPSRSTRNKSILTIERFKSNIGKHKFLNRSITYYNDFFKNLDIDIYSLNLNQIKKILYCNIN